MGYIQKSGTQTPKQVAANRKRKRKRNAHATHVRVGPLLPDDDLVAGLPGFGRGVLGLKLLAALRFGFRRVDEFDYDVEPRREAAGPTTQGRTYHAQLLILGDPQLAEQQVAAADSTCGWCGGVMCGWGVDG